MKKIIEWEIIKWLVPLVVDNAIKLIKVFKRKKNVQEKQTEQDNNIENGAIQGGDNRTENTEGSEQ